jgi:hypothetical protein
VAVDPRRISQWVFRVARLCRDGRIQGAPREQANDQGIFSRQWKRLCPTQIGDEICSAIQFFSLEAVYPAQHVMPVCMAITPCMRPMARIGHLSLLNFWTQHAVGTASIYCIGGNHRLDVMIRNLQGNLATLVFRIIQANILEQRNLRSLNHIRTSSFQVWIRKELECVLISQRSVQ